MMDVKDQYGIAIAAILHDIGKLKQRAFSGKEEFISREAKDMEAVVLPTNKYGGYSYRHALWTYDFFLADLIPCLNNKLRSSLDWEQVAISSSSHHRPSKGEWSEVIAKADRLSAGSDRLMSEQMTGADKYLRVPLKPITSNISIIESNSGKSIKSKYSYELRCLKEEGLGKAMFPKQQEEIPDGAYRVLFDSFLSEVKAAAKAITSPLTFLSKIKDLLYSYTWCVPSATNDYFNDISLYDHSVSTMSLALACALSENKELPFCICAMSVSGIQSFIFQSKNESFSNAAKVFRGRSFIISALSSAYKDMVCSELGIIPFVDLIDAGGKMTMILPNLKSIDSVLDSVQMRIDEFLLKQYFGTLAIVSDYSLKVDENSLRCFPDNEKSEVSFMKTIKEIGFRLNLKKNKKFASVLASMPVVWEYDKPDGTVCSACGKQSVDSDGFCSVCNGQKLLGKKLPHSAYINFTSDDGDYELLPGRFVSLIGEDEEPVSGTVFALRDSSMFAIWRLNMHVPEDKTFEEIAEMAVDEEGRGKAFLAYVKIDVDNLGKIFEEGFKTDSFTISRYVSLSRSLHYFFNSFTRHMLETKYPDAYTVLSGGDDVFIILPWNQAIYLVQDLQAAFKTYCCNNESFHFSAGIAVARKKEPFAMVNLRANQALDIKAKGVVGKNAVSYFNVTLKAEELRPFISECEKLSSYISLEQNDGKPFSSGFIYRLYGYVCDASDPQSGTTTNSALARKYSARSKLSYDIARNVFKEDEPSQIKDETSQIKNEAVNYLLERFNNYRSDKELAVFKTLLTHTIYNLRKE